MRYTMVRVIVVCWIFVEITTASVQVLLDDSMVI